MRLSYLNIGIFRRYLAQNLYLKITVTEFNSIRHYFGVFLFKTCCRRFSEFMKIEHFSIAIFAYKANVMCC